MNRGIGNVDFRRDRLIVRCHCRARRHCLFSLRFDNGGRGLLGWTGGLLQASPSERQDGHGESNTALPEILHVHVLLRWRKLNCIRRHIRETGLEARVFTGVTRRASGSGPKGYRSFKLQGEINPNCSLSTQPVA